MPVDTRGFLNMAIYLLWVKSARKCLCFVRFCAYWARRLSPVDEYVELTNIISVIIGIKNDVIFTRKYLDKFCMIKPHKCMF